MRQRLSVKIIGLALVLLVPIALLVYGFSQSTGVVRGKSSATPLSDQLSAEQQLAQDLALSDVRVQDYTVGRRSEVFGVRTVGNHFSVSAAACASADCRQVEIYNFDENVAVSAIVNVDTQEVLDVLRQPGVHPGINKRLADLALDIALNHPDVIDELGFRPISADMAPVDSSLLGTACAEGHLCVGPTFELGDRVLWAIVDLTDETLAGLNYTDMVPNNPDDATLFEPDGCTTPGSIDRDGWTFDYEVTGTDGLRAANVRYNGQDVATSIKLLEWHADYGSSGYEDYTGCGGGGGGFPISPYGDTRIVDIRDMSLQIIGFEVIQDFRMGSWGNYCNYRYEQHLQFYNDGRFRVVSGAYGKGCGSNAIYRPIVRIDIAVDGDGNDTFATWDGAQWVDQATENWWAQAGPYTNEGYLWRVTDQAGAGFYIEPGQSGSFNDGGRGDNAYIYLTQHKSAEGDTDLGIIGDCCFDDHRQGPDQYVNGEAAADQNIVLWYVPQMETDASPSHYYCWTVSGEPNPETYPCFTGPMFHPVDGDGAIAMSSASIQMRGRLLANSTTRAQAFIIVRGADGNRIADADVTVEWMLPDGSTTTATGATAANGSVAFQEANAAQGTYTITVQDIVHDGYYFDPAFGVTTMSLIVP